MPTLPISSVPAPAPHELRRERLLEILHRHSTRPLILLVAPAGFGKSTLAAAYARESGAVVAWLTLSAGDRDSRVLFGRLADTLEAAFEDPSALPELRRGLAQRAEGVGLARLLLVDLAQAPEGFILVLDDFHAVQESEEVAQAVDALVRGLPEMGQLVVTAREVPPLAMTRLVASDAVFGLGTEDLRFSPQETEELRRALGGDASRDGDAEGWVAGILLGGAPHQLSAAGGSLLGAYVEREVLGRLRASEQRWLETLAVVERITPAAAERLLGHGPWGARLGNLSQRCPFLVPSEDGSYRMHALVREALLNRLRRGSPARAERAWTVARQLAEEAYDTVGVVRACQELGRVEDAIALVRRSVEEAMEVSRWSAALTTLELLPEALRRAHPELSLPEARALLFAGRPTPARLVAEAALQHGGRSGSVVVQISALLELANIDRYAGDLTAALDWLSAADHLLLHNGLETRLQRRLEGRSLGLRGLCSAVRGDPREAREALESAERLLALNGPSQELTVVQRNLGSLYGRIGDYAGARRVLSEAVAHLRLIGDRHALATAQTLLGNLHLRMSDLDGAGELLGAAVEVARSVGATRIETHAMASLGDWHRANGRIDTAAAAYDESLHLAEELGESEPLTEALRLRAEVAIMQDQLSAARELLARAQAEAQRSGTGFQLAGIERALGRLHLAEGSGQRAISHLEEALRRGNNVWGPYERLWGQYCLGTAYLHLGKSWEAEEALRMAVALSGAVGGASALASPAAEDPRLLRHGIQAGVDPLLLREAHRVAEMRRPWSGVEQPIESHHSLQIVVRNDLPNLEVRMFGAMVVRLNGQFIEPGRRRADRARELLALLILHPNGLADREACELLWPHMPPNRGLHNLQMAAYALRRLVGSKAAVRYSAGSYQLAPQLELWADVRQFDAGLTKARIATADTAVEALQPAIDLYTGRLLADSAWDWTGPFRETYRSRYASAVLRLADLLAQRDAAAAEVLLEQLISMEPSREEAYERLLRFARARHDLAGARTVALRYRAVVGEYGLLANPVLLEATR